MLSSPPQHVLMLAAWIKLMPSQREALDNPFKQRFVSKAQRLKEACETVQQRAGL